MKHRPLNEMLNNPSTIRPEDIAQFAVMSSGINDHNKTKAIEDLIVAALETERSRLIEEAGMPIPVNAFHATCPNCQTSVDVIPSNNTFIFKQSETFEPDDFYKWATQFYKLHGRRPASGDCFTWMRSRCAALLLKEREKTLRFAEWATKEYIFYEPYNAWLTASGDRLTTSQLYDLFESQRKKGDS